MTQSVDIYGKVRRVLAESLGVDEDEIMPAARLQEELGAESIDFLDIVFRLEREFGIHIPRGELFPESVFGNDPNLCAGWVRDRRGPGPAALTHALCRSRRPRWRPETRRLDRSVHRRSRGPVRGMEARWRRRGRQPRDTRRRRPFGRADSRTDGGRAGVTIPASVDPDDDARNTAIWNECHDNTLKYDHICHSYSGGHNDVQLDSDRPPQAAQSRVSRTPFGHGSPGVNLGRLGRAGRRAGCPERGIRTAICRRLRGGEGAGRVHPRAVGRPRPVVGHAGSPLGRTCDPRPIPVPHVPLRQPPVHRGIGYPPRPGAGRGQSAVRPRGARPHLRPGRGGGTQHGRPGRQGGIRRPRSPVPRSTPYLVRRRRADIARRGSDGTSSSPPPTGGHRSTVA